MINLGLRNSLENNIHYTADQEFGDICIAVSIIPVVNPSEAKTYFDSGYGMYIEALFKKHEYKAGNLDIAHWILCCDGKNLVVHLLFMPAVIMLISNKSAMLYPQDFLTIEEFSRIAL